MSEAFRTIRVFTYAHEAHLAATMLESEGIESFVADQNTNYTFFAGGVRLQVREADVERALRALGMKEDEEGEDNRQ